MYSSPSWPLLTFWDLRIFSAKPLQNQLLSAQVMISPDIIIERMLRAFFHFCFTYLDDFPAAATPAVFTLSVQCQLFCRLLHHGDVKDKRCQWIAFAFIYICNCAIKIESSCSTLSLLGITGKIMGVLVACWLTKNIGVSHYTSHHRLRIYVRRRWTNTWLITIAFHHHWPDCT